ncbi:MAG: OmpH family outer membrane protein [Bacteroidota bacterium]
MNRYILPVVLITLSFSIFSFFYSHSGASSELVYIDVNKLLDGYERTATERALFEEKAAAMRANMDSLLGHWQAELQAYEKERADMTSKELKLKQELLNAKQNQLNNYQQAVQKQLQEEDQKITQTVINDINDFVKSYGESHGYRLILGATGSGSIMYAAEGTDLTDEVLEELNASLHAE